MVDGIAFERVKVGRSGQVKGILAKDTEIAGRTCHQGYVHVHANGVPAAFEAAEEILLPHVVIPTGAWVRQDPEGRVTSVAFPQDQEVQGYRCRGTGGPKGAQVSFHPNGAIRLFYLAEPTRIDGIPCDAGLARGWVELYEDGRLRSARLSEDVQFGSRHYRRGERLTMDRVGQVIEPDPIMWLQP